MKKFKCIIVDDEKLARDLLKEYMEDHTDLELIGEAAKGKEAVSLINKQKPDLVFLDVQMPGMDGFEVLEQLDHHPQVIFSTAYDQYALEAFDKNATDYLLKPIDQERFGRSIDRAIERLNNNDNNLAQLIATVKDQESAYLKSLFVQKSEKFHHINVEDIVNLEASGDYTIIITERDQYLSSSGISKVEAKLNPEKFIRIHRSTIINLDYLKEIEKHFNGGLMVKMKNNKRFSVSRTYARKIREKII